MDKIMRRGGKKYEEESMEKGSSDREGMMERMWKDGGRGEVGSKRYA